MNKFKLTKIDWSIKDILHGESKFSWQENEKKPINVFYMGNRWGKTLIFSLLYELLSWENDYNIHPSYSDISLNVSASNWDDEFSYYLNGKTVDIKLWDNIISKDEYISNMASQLSIFENLISNFWIKPSRKNTLKSMFRYIFISDHDLYKKNRWESTEQKLVNFKYDWYLKKALLAYFLWLNLTNKEFQNLGEYYYRENYLSENRKTYNDYNDQFSLFNDDDATEIFYQYSNLRKQLWDVTVAIEHINRQIKISTKLWDSAKYKDEISFLKSQLKILEKTKNKLKQDISILSKKINKIRKLWISVYSWKENVKEIVRNYKTFSNEIENFKNMNANNITKVENLLSKCWIFVKEYFWKLWYNNVDVNLLEQTFKSDDPRSDWEMTILRILWTILINIFSNMNKWRLINVCIFDTTFESIDENKWHELFEKIETLYEIDDINKFIPQIFCFITWTKDRFSVKNINKYNVTMDNFIDFDSK